MKTPFSHAAIVATAIVMMMFWSMTALAGTKITNVSVYMSENREDPGIIWTVSEPQGSTGWYDVEEYTWSQDPSVWVPGQSVTLTVTVRAANDNSFDQKISGSCSYGVLKSISRKSPTKAVLHIQYTPKIQLETPDGLYYEGEDSYLLRWNRVKNAYGYAVQITKDGYYLTEITINGKNNTEFNMAGYVTDSDSIYSAKVKAVGSPAHRDAIYDSDYASLDTDISQNAESTVSGRFFGSGNYRYFQTSDGQNATGWQLINGVWYYFDPKQQNYAAADRWCLINNYWYHFDPDGKMQTGWYRSSDGLWYLLNDSRTSSQPYGSMLTGWVCEGPGGCWYYFHSDGHMAVSETVQGYKIDSNGKWKKIL